MTLAKLRIWSVKSFEGLLADSERVTANMRVLVVCNGNTCRSPMAAGLLTAIAKERGVNVEVRSAGLAHHPNTGVAVHAVRVMGELRIDISADYSKPVTPETVNWADIIVGVQRSHAAHLLEDYPSAEPKLRFLDKDVRDPYCDPIDEYRRVRDELRMLLSRLISSLEFDRG